MLDNIWLGTICCLCNGSKIDGCFCRTHNNEFYEWYNSDLYTGPRGSKAVENWVALYREFGRPLYHMLRCAECNSGLFAEIDYLCSECRTNVSD